MSYHQAQDPSRCVVVAVLPIGQAGLLTEIWGIGNISVDISIYDDGGIRASRIVGGFLKQYPVARELVLLVKAYMRKYKINEVFMGGLGSYSTFCLVISFLQVRTVFLFARF
jgi:non-canonical poly(A) RNA polymerase PAPD5/7